MTHVDLNTTPTGTYDMSTTLSPDPATPEVGQGTPSMSPEAPDTLENVLADEVKKARASDDAEKSPEADPKAEAKPDDKADPKDDPKGDKPEAKAEEAKPDDPAEKKAEAPEADPKAEAPKDTRPEAPARFTEEAKSVWRNTPRAVKEEVFRALDEAERASETHREATRLHEELRDYAAQARQHGTTIKAALDRYVHFDRALMQDFGKGVATLAKDAGHSPETTVAQILRAYGTTPQQYAQMVLKNPAAHQVQAPPPRDPLIAQIAQQNQVLMQRLEQQEVQQKLSAVQSQVDEWAKSRPDYSALQGKVAKIIESGIVEEVHGSGLSLVQRLEAAYRIAGGRAGSPDPSATPADPTPAESPVDPDAGRKSVRGAPSDGLTPAADPPNETMQDFLRKELRKIRA